MGPYFHLLHFLQRILTGHPESAARRSGGNCMWMEAAREIYTKIQPPPPHHLNLECKTSSTLSIFRPFLAKSVQWTWHQIAEKSERNNIRWNMLCNPTTLNPKLFHIEKWFQDDLLVISGAYFAYKKQSCSFPLISLYLYIVPSSRNPAFSNTRREATLLCIIKASTLTISISWNPNSTIFLTACVVTPIPQYFLAMQ